MPLPSLELEGCVRLKHSLLHRLKQLAMLLPYLTLLFARPILGQSTTNGSLATISNSLEWEHDISGTLRHLAQHEPEERRALVLSIELTDVDGLKADDVASALVIIVTRNVVNNKILSVEHRNTEGYETSNRDPEIWQANHDLFYWPNDLNCLSVADALELAELEAEARGMGPSLQQCTISMFDSANIVYFLFRQQPGPHDPEGMPAILINSRTRAVVYIPDLVEQEEENQVVEPWDTGNTTLLNGTGISRSQNRTQGTISEISKAEMTSDS